MAQILKAGAEIDGDTLSRFYSIHMLVLPAAIAGLILLHLYLVIRLGVSNPPWGKQPEDMDEDDEAPARQGLVQPSRREETASELARASTSASSRRTRRTSRSTGSRSSRTRCSTTR